MLAEGTDRFADEFGHLSLKIGFAQLAGEAVREYFVERQPWARRQGKAGTKGIVIGAGEEITQPFGQSSGVEPLFVDQQFGFGPDADIFTIKADRILYALPKLAGKGGPTQPGSPRDR